MHTSELSPNNKVLFDTLKKLNLPLGKYVIFGAGPMMIRNLKDGHDLDLFVTHDLFEEYRHKEGWKIYPCNEDFYLRKNGIELWETWRPGEWDVYDLIKNAEIIDGFPFVSLDDVLKWKKLNNRDKDKEHIKILEKYHKDQIKNRV